MDARAWESSKPNLLNVAITRAKCRLYVIGNTQEWGQLNHFRALHDALGREPVLPLRTALPLIDPRRIRRPLRPKIAATINAARIRPPFQAFADGSFTCTHGPTCPGPGELTD